MATHDEGSAEGPLDPVYASLFRPDSDPAPAAEPGPFLAAPEPEAEPAVAPAEDESHAAPEPAEAGGAGVDTGRLFRSQGVTDNSVAVLAIDRGRRLRTLERSEAPGPEPSAAPVAAGVEAGASSPTARADQPLEAAVPMRSATSRGGRRQIKAGAVYLVVFGVTLLVAFADALLFGGELGWPTGIALVVSSAYCALTVRREDDVVAIIVPPLAFLLAAMTAGQFFRGPTAGDVLNRAQLVFFTLAYNWYWVIGATVLAVVIVLVRRRR